MNNTERGNGTAKTTPAQYRQGDVLVVAATIPDGATPVALEHGKVILAHGEVTGHYHGIDGSAATMYEKDGERYLHVGPRKPGVKVKPWKREAVADYDPAIDGVVAKLIHDEHNTIDIPAGTYKVRRQREYRRGEIKRVVD